jgi:hypothetical protein
MFAVIVAEPRCVLHVAVCIACKKALLNVSGTMQVQLHCCVACLSLFLLLVLQLLPVVLLLTLAGSSSATVTVTSSDSRTECLPMMTGWWCCAHTSSPRTSSTGSMPAGRARKQLQIKHLLPLLLLLLLKLLPQLLLCQPAEDAHILSKHQHAPLVQSRAMKIPRSCVTRPAALNSRQTGVVQQCRGWEACTAITASAFYIKSIKP